MLAVGVEHREDLALEAALVGGPAGVLLRLRTPNASMSSRLMPHLSAISSAEMPCGTSPPAGA